MIQMLSGFIQTAQQQIVRALHWWLGELRSFLPPSTLRFIQWKRSVPLELCFGEKSVTLEIADKGGDRSAEIPYVIFGDSRGLSQFKLENLSNKSGSETVIYFDASQTFETSIDLPLSAENTLRQILQYQMDRIVPLDPTTVRFSFRILHRLRPKNIIRVGVLVTKLSTVERAIDYTKLLDLSPRAVLGVWSDKSGKRGEPTELWASKDFGRRRGGARRLKRVLEAGAMTLFVIGLGLRIYRLDDARQSLRAEVNQAKQLAAAVENINARTLRTNAALAFLKAKQAQGYPLRVVQQVTNMIPSDTWVSQLTIRKGLVELVGLSPHAADLSGRIESSAFFQQPHFVSAITLGPDGKTERYDLEFQVKAVLAAQNTK